MSYGKAQGVKAKGLQQFFSTVVPKVLQWTAARDELNFLGAAGL